MKLDLQENTLRVSYSQRKAIRKYLKNPGALSKTEYKSIERFFKSGAIPDYVIKLATQPPDIQWSKQYQKVYDNPNSIKDKSDYLRRERLVECGYLRRVKKNYIKCKEKGSIKPKPLYKRLLECTSKKEFEILTNENRGRIEAAKTLYLAYERKHNEFSNM